MFSIIISLSTEGRGSCGEIDETTKRRSKKFCGKKSFLKEYQNLAAAREGKWQ